MTKEEWILCPVCKNKTRLKIREDTALEKFPLFCPKCKQETLSPKQREHLCTKQSDVPKSIPHLIKAALCCRIFTIYCFMR